MPTETTEENNAGEPISAVEAAARYGLRETSPGKIERLAREASAANPSFLQITANGLSDAQTEDGEPVYRRTSTEDRIRAIVQEELANDRYQRVRNGQLNQWQGLRDRLSPDEFAAKIASFNEANPEWAVTAEEIDGYSRELDPHRTPSRSVPQASRGSDA